MSAEPLTGTSTGTVMKALSRGGVEYAFRIGLGLAVIPVVLHRVGADVYGVWVAISTVLAVGSMADLGVRTEVTRRVAAAWGAGDREGAKRSTREGSAILVATGGLLVVLGVVGASTISAWVFPRGVPGVTPGEIDELIRACVVLLGLGLVADGHFAVLRGVQRTDLESICRTVGEVSGSLVTILWVLSGGGLWALFTGAAVQLGADYAGRAWATHRVAPGIGFGVVRPRNLRVWLAASGLLVTAQVSEVIDVQWDKLVLARYVGAPASAAYNVGTTLVGQAKVLALLPLVPLVAAAAELAATRPERLDRIYRRLGTASFAVGAVVLGAVVVFAPTFIRLWLGSPGLPGAALAAQVSAIAIAFNLLPAPLVMREIGSGRMGAPAAGAIANVVTNGVVSFLLTRLIGFDGALYGSIAGNVAGAVVFFGALRAQGRLRMPGLRAAAAAGIVAAGAWALLRDDRTGGWVVLAVSAFAYVILQVAVVLMAAGSEDRRDWFSVIRRAGWHHRLPPGDDTPATPATPAAPADRTAG